MVKTNTPPVNGNRRWQPLLPLTWVILFITWGCGGGAIQSQDSVYTSPATPLPPMNHTIQVGAFSNMSNAVRLAEKLQANGINAYHFQHDSGLYKVRFGNFSSREAARNMAERLKITGLIEEYFLVGPHDFALYAYPQGDIEHLREAIVNTAKRYVGVPYRWGGESPRSGFDCSGLTMVVYRLNGLDLPRSSRQQWQAGRPVKRSQMVKGDLVFFATAGGRRVSHVGIYTGDGKFLHAPSSGRKIRMSSLSNRYYHTRYLGARTYL